MSDKTEITFMQTRLIRLASEEWHLPVEQIIRLFKETDVLGYIEHAVKPILLIKESKMVLKGVIVIVSFIPVNCVKSY